MRRVVLWCWDYTRTSGSAWPTTDPYVPVITCLDDLPIYQPPVLKEPEYDPGNQPGPVITYIVLLGIGMIFGLAASAVLFVQ